MLGMDAASLVCSGAISAREPILIYGDYDVDGKSVVIRKRACELLGEWRTFTSPPHPEGYAMRMNVIENAAYVVVAVNEDSSLPISPAAYERPPHPFPAFRWRMKLVERRVQKFFAAFGCRDPALH